MEWKLTLRAEIHYNLSLQQRFLRRWKLFHIQRKSSRIKGHIAVIYHRKNCAKQHKRLYISKWKMYIKYRREKKQKLQLARAFFKSKYKPEMLFSYYDRWKIFTKATKKNKLRLFNAERFFENKLAVWVIKQLQKYAKENKEERVILANAAKYFEKKLLKNSIKIWLLFIKQKRRKDENNLLAKAHYCFKLKFNSFQRIVKNKDRNRFIKYILVVTSEQQCKRIKTCYFNKLKKYVKYRVHKKQKICYAMLYYKNRLKKGALGRWKDYLRYRAEKKKNQQRLLENVIFILNKYVLRKYFTNWKKFKTYKIQEKLKYLTATNFHRKYVQSKTFKAWKYFMSYKKCKRKKEIEAINYHNSNVKTRSITMWKSFIKEENNFREKLLEAKNYYQRKIINEGLLVVVKAGLQVKEEKLGRCRDKIYRQLFLAQKYVGIWKQNVFYKNIGNETTPSNSADDVSLEECKENIPQASSLEWYQICFLTPRLPKTYTNLANDS